MAFRNVGSLVPYGGPVLRSEIVANSTTLTALDALKIDTDGFIIAATAAVNVFGHLTDVVTNKGTPVNTSGAAGAELGSYVGTFATASDNETVAMVRAITDISQFTVYHSGAPAAGTFGTTTAGSGELGVRFDLSDEDSVDETSVVAQASGTAQYFSWGKVVGENAITMNILESQVFNS